MLCQLQTALGHGLLAQRLIAEHALGPGMIGQRLQRLQAMLAGGGVAPQARHETAQGLPMRQQLSLATRIRLRKELGQFGEAFIYFIQARRNDQRPALQHDQARCADEQVLRQLAAPFQKMRHVVADQQLLLAVALQIVGRHFRLASPQCVLDRLAHFVAAGEPLAGAQMDVAGRNRFGQPLQQ